MLHICTSALISYDASTVVFPESRSAYIRDTSNASVKNQRYTSWCLLKYAAEKYMNTEFEELVFSKNGERKWICDSFYFSLSHTENFAAVAVSDAPVGVDIESVNRFQSSKKAASLYKRIATENEQMHYQEKHLPLLWTGKEAAFKAGRETLFMPSLIDVIVQQIQWYTYNGLVLALCSPDIPETIEIVDPLLLSAHKNHTITSSCKKNWDMIIDL